MKAIQKALISVYHKQGLEPIVEQLKKYKVAVYSTGGTQKYLEELGVEVHSVESLTGYPSILGGRVKTLHPKVFGGILHRSEESKDQAELQEYDIPAFDLVIVDLYPFEDTLAQTQNEPEIIEKIDIGGISLIRAAAKNYRDVAVVASQKDYTRLAKLLETGQGAISMEERKALARIAFEVSSHYDAKIYGYFAEDSEEVPALKVSIPEKQTLRYGENPHQKGYYYGDLSQLFTQLHGKALSFNNLVDVDAAIALNEEFEACAYTIIKHTNACGAATAQTPKEAYLKALAGDPVSAFGGVIASNRPVDLETAQELHKLFFEILIAPDFDADALEVLKGKKNRILLQKRANLPQRVQFKTVLNGVIAQDGDYSTETREDFQTVSQREPETSELSALEFALKVMKHSKSNSIVLAYADQLIGSGVGQTSRVDAVKQAIAKARSFGFDPAQSVLASDAFFPFPDSVELAHEAGIKAIVQPGGSIRDQESIDACDQNSMAMVFTGKRHFKH